MSVPAACQAVRCELVRETETGPHCEGSEGNNRALEATRVFLHLLGPDTLRPALQALQCPVPARRRSLVQEELQSLGCEIEEFGHYADIQVTYNGGGVLSLLLSESTDFGGPNPNNEYAFRNYDLATGRACDVAQWLRPGGERALRQLLTRALLADSIGRNLLPASGVPGLETAPCLMAALPEMGLNPQGVYCTLGSFGAPHVIKQAALTIPFAALRPYARAGSPLARMLAAMPSTESR